MSSRYSRGVEIGRGRFGVVYQGHDDVTNETVAIKVLPIASPNAVIDVRREYDMLVELRHPNIVEVRALEVDHSKGQASIVMECCPGGSVQTKLETFRLYEVAIRRHTKAALLGLAYLHEKKRRHGDIKPANMLLALNGLLKLSDFGTCVSIQDMMEVGKFVGTPCYAAPEALKGTVGTASDIWSLGASIVHMATGFRLHYPWHEKGFESPEAIAYFMQNLKEGEHPTIPEHLSSDAVNFLKRCFVVDPNQRATCTDLLEHAFVVNDPSECPDCESKEHYAQQRACAPPAVTASRENAHMVAIGATANSRKCSPTPSSRKSSPTPSQHSVEVMSAGASQSASHDPSSLQWTDSGQPDYFTHMPPDVTFEEAVKRAEYSTYSVCTSCDIGLRMKCVSAHDKTRCVPMTAEWVLEKCNREAPQNFRATFAYTLDTPLRYEADASMRNVEGDGRNPFDNTKACEEEFVKKYCYFLYHLVAELRPFQNMKATMYRLLPFRVCPSMYFPGAIVTWNQPSVAVLDVCDLSKSFKKDANTTVGDRTIFVIYATRAKSLSDLHRRREAILLPNTQFRVGPPVSRNMKDMLARALRRDLSDVLVIELTEVKLHYYVDVYKNCGQVLLNGYFSRIESFLEELKLKDRNFLNNERVWDPVMGSFDVKRAFRPMATIPSPTFFKEMLDRDVSVAGWALFLHRLSPETILSLTYGTDTTILVEAIRRCHKRIPFTADFRDALVQYSVPWVGEVVNLLVDKTGLENVYKALDTCDDATQLHTALLCSFAALNRSDHLSAYFKDRENDITSTAISAALFSCASNGAVNSTHLLLAKNVPPSAPKDENDLTPVHVAAAFGHKDCLAHLLNKNERWLSDSVTRSNITPLHLACIEDQYDVAKFLIERDRQHGSKLILAQTEVGTTCLMFACETGNQTLCHLLVSECAALLNTFDKKHRSPLYRATARGHITLVEYFVKAKPKLLEECRSGGVTVMHIACQNNHLDVVKYLAEVNKELVNKCTDEGKSCMDLASENQALDVCNFLQALENERHASGRSAGKE
eukprot:PhM_4_TR15916/c3_g1_i1/m.3350